MALMLLYLLQLTSLYHLILARPNSRLVRKTVGMVMK